MRSGHRHRSPLSGEAGYTLTEMLVVIGIICLIAAVLTPAVMGQMGRARVKAAELQLETLSSAVEAFQSDVGRLPTQREGLTALIREPGGVEGWAGPYARSTSLKDPWGRPVMYSVDVGGQTFLVQSLGADGKVGGSGRDRDLKAPNE